jgi:DNA-binding beta-propeller fold protein YncE
MQIERVNSDGLTENRLPDGSRILVDAHNEKVIALNATAGAVWEACSAPTTLAQITAEMQRTITPDVSEVVAANAIRQLEEQNLVRTSAPADMSSRRAFIGRMGAVAALPVVAALTLTEQRAYAYNSGSGNPGKHQPPKPRRMPPPPPPRWWW